MAKPTPEILVYGYIGPYDEVDYASFRAAFIALEKDYPECTMRIHCGGGSCIEGLAIYDLMTNSPMKVNGIVEGMAASMGSILALGCDHISIVANGRFMTHKVKAGFYGEAEGMKAQADLIDKLEKDIVKIYMDRTGKDEETIKTWMRPGVEKWHTAKEAKANGLVDEIIPGNKDIDNKKLTKKSAEAFHSEVLNYLTPENSTTDNNPNSNNMSLKLRLIALLTMNGVQNSLSENDSDDKVYSVFETHMTTQKTALETAKADLATAENKLKDQKKTQIKSLLDDAQACGKFAAADRPKWEERADKDYEMTADSLAAIPGVKKTLDNVSRTPATAAVAASGSVEDRTAWDYKKWSQEDPQGLAKMETENPEAFNKLVQNVSGKLKQNGMMA